MCVSMWICVMVSYRCPLSRNLSRYVSVASDSAETLQRLTADNCVITRKWLLPGETMRLIIVSIRAQCFVLFCFLIYEYICLHCSTHSALIHQASSVRFYHCCWFAPVHVVIKYSNGVQSDTLQSALLLRGGKRKVKMFPGTHTSGMTYWHISVPFLTRRSSRLPRVSWLKLTQILLKCRPNVSAASAIWILRSAIFWSQLYSDSLCSPKNYHRRREIPVTMTS